MYFLRHKLPFQYNPIIGNLERISLIRWKTTNQRFGLGFKPNRKDYKRTANIRREKRLARLEKRELEQENITIHPIHISFPKATYMAHSEDVIDVPT